MDPFTLIGVAANLARVIIHLTYTYKLQSTHIGILVDRITSLEKPLETLERAGQNNNKISEPALRKLIGTLEDVQRMVLEHQRTDNKSKTKRFLFGDANMDDIKLLRERLDSSLLDLQLAITVEEAGKSDQRVHLTARATVDILLNSVQQRATETILKCVQCDKEYRQSENAVGSCKYHTAFPRYSSWKFTVGCCGKQFKSEAEATGPDCEGCTRGVHCDFHHTQYSYTAYSTWMRTQLSSNIKETWLRVSDWDFEDGIDKYASFGVSNDNLLFVALGKGHYPLYLQYFDPQNMPQVHGPVIGDMMTIAMRGSDINPGEFEKNASQNKWIVDALWTLDPSSGQIHGIRLSSNSLSSKFPIIKELSLSFHPLTKGSTRILSFSAAPAKAIYTDEVPECSSSFTPFPDSVSQQPPMEPTYETINTGNMQIRLKKCAPCEANSEFSSPANDTFHLQFYIMNLSQSATMGSSSEERMVVLNLLKDGKMNVEEAIKLLSTLDASPHQHGAMTFVDTRARFYINDRWVSASRVETKMKKEDKLIPALPFEVAPRAATKVVVDCTVASPEKKNVNGGWFGRAYVCRLTPITIEVTFEEMSGQTTSIMAQFANPPVHFNDPPNDNLFWIHVDDFASWTRAHVAIMPPNLKDYPEACFEINIGTSRKSSISFRDLLRWGYEAVKANSAIYELKDISTDNSSVFYGLIDLVAGVTCGFKIQVRSDHGSYNEGIWMIPEDLFLASRKACIGEDVEKSWNSNEMKPILEPTTAVPKFGPPRTARLGTRPDPPTNPPPTPSSSSNTTPPAHTPPSNPLPPVPTANAPPSAQPPSAQPPTSPPVSSPSLGPSTGPRTTQPNGFVRTTPTPPPRTSNGLTKTPSNGSVSPSPSPSPSPAPSTTPAPAPTPAPIAPGPASAPSSPAIDALLLYSPPPLNQPSAAAAAAAASPPPQKGENAMRCMNCTMGMKKDECVKCKANVPALPNVAKGLICNFCKVQMRGKCISCDKMITSKPIPSIMCGKCSFGISKDKCLKCNKIIN